jgi:6-hydroxycyclohex-1-ene-1-carbonyl-CoA dehydrogenase
MTDSTLVTPYRWIMTASDHPLERTEFELPEPGPSEVLIQVAGCGVCHTDLGFLYGGVRTRHALPLALGHEISGVVVAAGSASEWTPGQAVIVPAVMPCGHCDACTSGYGTVCKAQIMPGNDCHGGFASHVVVPSNGLCPVPGYDSDQPNALLGDSDVDLAALSVVADAVTTPYQALERARVREGDLVCVVGLGGVGGFAAQIAAARGARVIGFDPNTERLEQMKSFGVSNGFDPSKQPARQLRSEVRSIASEAGHRAFGWKIFECSGTRAGQELAYGLLGPAAYLSVVGYTLDKLELRLSNLMAFDAKAAGNWGCLPEFYPAALDTVLSGAVKVEPFIERFPLGQVQQVLERLQAHELRKRAVLIPESPCD